MPTDLPQKAILEIMFVMTAEEMSHHSRIVGINFSLELSIYKRSKATQHTK